MWRKKITVGIQANVIISAHVLRVILCVCVCVIGFPFFSFIMRTSEMQIIIIILSTTRFGAST